MREYSRVKASRLAGRLAWTKWARAFGGVVGRTALGGIGVAATAAQLGYHGVKAYKAAYDKRMATKRGRVTKKRIRTKRRLPRKNGKPVRAFAMSKRKAVIPKMGMRKRARYAKKRHVAGTEIRFIKRRAGRPRRNTSKLMRLASVKWSQQRHQNVAAIDNGPERGANWLTLALCDSATITASVVTGTNGVGWVENSSTLATWAAGTHWRLPFHMYLLNGHPTLGVTNSTILGMQPFMRQSDGAVVLGFLPGIQNQTNAAVTVWQNEYSTVSDTGYTPRYCAFDRYDCTLQLRNATSQTTRFVLMYVSFKEPWLDPIETPTDAQQLNDRRNFYMELASQQVKPFAANPGIAWKRVLQRVNVHKKMYVTMDRQQTTDTDQSPDVKVVKLSLADGRVYDYQWNAGSSGFNSNQMFNPGYWVNQTYSAAGSQPQYVPKPRARRYLIVAALDPTYVAVDAANGSTATATWSALSSSTTPSYDIMIRRSVKTTIA